jgi:hypothetical protein
MGFRMSVLIGFSARLLDVGQQICDLCINNFTQFSPLEYLG